MKKLMLTAAVLLAGLGMAKADMRQTPTGPDRSLATADYGGVYVGTQAFLISGTGAGYSTACISCSGVFYGIIFSTGNNSDFADVYDSTSADRGLIEGPLTRVYNVNASTGGQNAYPTAGFSGPPKPIRFSKGLIYRTNRGDINRIDALYYSEP